VLTFRPSFREDVMPKMRCVQVSRAGGPLEIVERDVPEPKAGEVRLKVQACGICHSDTLTTTGLFGVTYPRVPGHEVAGVIDAVGPGAQPWKVGQRVGVGWHAGHDNRCESCRRGDFMTCQNERIAGLNADGGYTEYMVNPIEGLVLIPDSLSPIEAAPLLDAGVTTFNALRNSGARPGDLVAVLGLGGLGHLGVQFAARMGMNTVGIARGKEKEGFARELGARHYIDSQAKDPAAELLRLGGAKIILATASSAKAMTSVFGGLAPNGKLLVIGADLEPLGIPPSAFIQKRLSIVGWSSGTSIDSQDTLAFCAATGVRSMNETFPFEKVKEGFDRMLSGKARFRVVLTISK
jgi:alcohol dehydrogenase/propanol-preferring alcohol dehydrogenase